MDLTAIGSQSSNASSERNGRESISASPKTACSDTGSPSPVSSADGDLGKGCDDALSSRVYKISSIVEDKNGWCLDTSQGGDVIRTSCLIAKRNCRGEISCGKACLYALVGYSHDGSL